MTPAFLIAALQARAEGDDESFDELRSLMGDPEHAAALLEQVEDGEEEPDAPTDEPPATDPAD